MIKNKKYSYLYTSKEPVKEDRDIVLWLQLSLCQILVPVLLLSLGDAWTSGLKPDLSTSYDL